jgi:hypothetical protein
MTLQRVSPDQLRFKLPELDEVQDDASERAITSEEARTISEMARNRFLNGDRPQWFDDYLRYIDLGWPWRVAAYIAWASSPKRDRLPHTIRDLALVLGLTSPRAIYSWRSKFKTIDSIVSLEQAAPLFEHRSDLIDALIRAASDPGYKGHNDRKLAFEMLGDYVPKSRLKLEDGRSAKDETNLADDELRSWADGLDVDPTLTADEDEEGDDEQPTPA